MVVWIIMILVQPWLIMRKKTKLHKRIGKLSYFIMPVVLFTAWLMIRHSYFQFMADETAKVSAAAQTVTQQEMNARAAEYMSIGVLYWLWLGVFYVLAVINRKKIVAHATYMFAAILTLLGPTLDRIIIPLYVKYDLNIHFFITTFILINLLLLALVLYQFKKGTAIKPALVSLGIYIAGQLLYFFLPGRFFWNILIDPF